VSQGGYIVSDISCEHHASAVSAGPVLYGCSPLSDELLSVVNMDDAQHERTNGRRAGKGGKGRKEAPVSANFLDITKVYWQASTINDPTIGRLFLRFFDVRIVGMTRPRARARARATVT